MIDEKEVMIKSTTSRLLERFNSAKRVVVNQYDVPVNPKLVLFNCKINGNDDSIYSKNRHVWESLPRGMSLIFDRSGKQVGNIQGLRKFGYFEDREKLPYGDYKKANYMVCMEKENGENAQVTAFRFEDELYWFAGSKNVHIAFRDEHDLDHEFYSSPRYNFATNIARLVLSKYQSKGFQCWLADNKFTAVGEAILRSSQHIVDYGEQEDHIRFFAVTSEDCAPGKLTALSVNEAQTKFKSFGLPVPWISDEVKIGSKEYDQLMDSIVKRENSEGCVGYATDLPRGDVNSHVQYMCKLKSVGYVLERSARGAILRSCTPSQIRTTVNSTRSKVFPDEAYDLAVKQWMETRLEFLTNFAGWVIAERRGNPAQDTQREWLTLQQRFMSLNSDKNWWNDLGEVKHTIVVAARGIPCSGKSSLLRALQYVLHNTGKSTTWLNQDELGRRDAYLRAFKGALSTKPDYILLDKSNRDPRNLSDIYEIIHGPLDFVLNLAHPDDKDDFDIPNARKLCKERFEARGKAHRTLTGDVDIENVLDTFQKLGLNAAKLSHYASNVQNVDMTLEKTDMLKVAVDAVLPGANITKEVLNDAIRLSQEYENLLADEEIKKQHYGYFGIFFKQFDAQSILQDLPEHVLSNKTLNQNFHVTLQHQGGFIEPKVYKKLIDYVKEERKTHVHVMRLFYDDNAVTAEVQIAEKSIPCVNRVPHITLALASDTLGAYSNILLQSVEASKVDLDEPITLEGTVRGGNPVQVAPKAAKAKPAAKKLAIELEGPIYSSILSKHPMLKDAWENLEALKDLDYEIYLVTCCDNEETKKVRKRLAEDNLLKITAGKKWLFAPNQKQMANLLMQHDIKLLVDNTTESYKGVRVINFSTWRDVLKKLEGGK